ncbi:hypothetical protein QQZ08_001837 [Neonectria magnoliae]|uniref:Uncharacterized protein n=1 Tax=Neonectria magnoliae TaxID=2732573 RepID=A0ABR1IDI0_9HYPO
MSPISKLERADELGSTPLSCLPEPHRGILIRAVSNVLSCDEAEVTFAQIVDGMPLSEVEEDSYDDTACPEHPIHTKHTQLCPGVLEKTRQFRNDVDASELAFSPMLFKWQETHGCHLDDGLSNWVAPKDHTVWWARFPVGRAPTLLRHSWYCRYDQYPNGVADGVGYWAESRIFGGVILFDRRQPDLKPPIHPEPAVDPDAVYFHSCRYGVTYRIYKLLDAQKHELLQFLLSDESPPSSCPLPIVGSKENTERVDPEDSAEENGIYRDKWERPELEPDASDYRTRDVRERLNYPTMQDWKASSGRGADRRYFLRYGRSVYDSAPDEEFSE